MFVYVWAFVCLLLLIFFSDFFFFFYGLGAGCATVTSE